MVKTMVQAVGVAVCAPAEFELLEPVWSPREEFVGGWVWLLPVDPSGLSW
jgi:hypothetical protein